MHLINILSNPKLIIKGICIILYRYIFRLKHISYGKNMKIYNRIRLQIGRYTKISVGHNFTFTSGGPYNPICRNIIGAICVHDNAFLYIGDNVGISSSCVWSHKSIIIGNNVLIGGDTIIMDSDCHSLNFLDRRVSCTDIERKVCKGIIIEDDVLIGARSIVLKGVRIGARSVIGAGSIVAKDIPSDCIAAGNPCIVIKKLR